MPRSRSCVSTSPTPRPSRLGFWAMTESSRPRRFRCWKCWSTITPGRSPRPAARAAIRIFGVPLDAPKPIMCLDFPDAPAEQAGILGDDREQPAEAVPLLEVLVDDH